MPRHLTAIILSVAILIVLSISASADAQTRWRAFPVRSQQQYEDGLVGGAAEQFMHSAARSPSDPQVIYLSHDCAQVWRSDNNGDLWHKPMCEGMWAKSGQSIEVDPVKPYTVFAIMDTSSDYVSRPYEGLFRSHDGGESWEEVLVHQGDSQRQYQHNIAYDPTTITDDGAQRWYAAFPAGGLFISEDAGDTWQEVASLSSHSNLYSVQCDIADGQTVFVGSSSGLFRSDNRGSGLAACGNLPGGTISCIAMHPTIADTMYVVVSGVGLYKSVDGGDTFTLMRSGDATGIFLNPGYPDIMYLSSTSSDLRVSHDGGVSWSVPTCIAPEGLQRESRDDINGGHTSVLPNPIDPDEAVVHGHAMMWKTIDNGATFYDASMLFTGYNWGWWNDGVGYDIADPNRFIFFLFDVGMVETENGGLWFERHKLPYSWYSSGLLNWRSMHAGDVYPVTGSDYFIAGGGRTFNTKLIRSTNWGDSYQIINDHYNINLFIAFNLDDPSIVYAGDQISTDTGNTFTVVPYLDAIGGSIFGMCREHPDTIYAIDSTRRQIHRSDDAGVTWRLYVEAGWSLRRLDSKPCFAVHPTNPDIVYSIDASGDAASFDGTSWTSLGVLPLAEPTPQTNHVYNILLDPRHPEIIYAKMFAPGGSEMFRSTDSGASWTDITYNLPRVGGATFNIHPLTGDVMVSSCLGTRMLPAPYADPASLYTNLPGQPPVARAGADITVNDSDGNGLETVTLNASDSIAPDTNIVMYLWQIDGSPIAYTETANVPLPVGTTEIELLIIDDDNVTDSDSIVVTVTDNIGGDADSDGDVDIYDFLILRSNYGTKTGAVWADGDFDGDQDVDIYDFLILRSNYDQY